MWGRVKKWLLRKLQGIGERLTREPRVTVSPYEIVMQGEENKTSNESNVKTTTPTDETNDDIATGVTHERFPVMIRYDYDSEETPEQVFVCGSWDQWAWNIPLCKTSRDFSTVLSLEEGHYEFKFLVDNKWVINKNLPFIDSGEQLKNTVTVEKKDYEECPGETTSKDAPLNNPTTTDDKEVKTIEGFAPDITTEVVFTSCKSSPVRFLVENSVENLPEESALEEHSTASSIDKPSE
ncbi:hypothetical protein Angca_010014 [Angiostrongylus cantonensis]|nr:hypothetical protein Angca_010014 [Angiostrongylus cantonensis]